MSISIQTLCFELFAWRVLLFSSCLAGSPAKSKTERAGAQKQLGCLSCGVKLLCIDVAIGKVQEVRTRKDAFRSSQILPDSSRFCISSRDVNPPKVSLKRWNIMLHSSS